jgi:adenylate cyclase class IV
MKVYKAHSHISYEFQRRVSFKLDKIFDMTLNSLGSSLLTQIYKDLPQCFTQQNLDEKSVTKYQVEVVVMDKQEYQEILRRLGGR